MINSKLFKRETIRNWDKLIECFNYHQHTKWQWIFRGQGKSKWGLETTLERDILSFWVSNPGDSFTRRMALSRILSKKLKGLRKSRSVSELEYGLIRRFKRQSERYIKGVYEKENFPEWFALMRHYGAPVRLIDWTYSFFVALYFALEESEGNSAVWAFNTDSMRDALDCILRNYQDAWGFWNNDRGLKNPETFKAIFMREAPITLVAAVSPYRQIERVTIQQGVFLCQGNIFCPFEENFEAILSQLDSKDRLIKYTFRLSLKDRKDIIRKLHQMNINNATLFPGLDGFAKSLKASLAYPDILEPDAEDKIQRVE